MSRGEKLAILRVRANALRERALVVERAFTEAAMRASATAVRTAIEQELERLEAASSAPLPPVKQFLPGPVARLKALETVLRRIGPHATPGSAGDAVDDRRSPMASAGTSN